jgi:hypothetical protein
MTKEKAKEKYQLCFEELERVMGLNEEPKRMLEICSSRTLEEYKYSLRLIHSAKYYLNIFYSDFLYLLYSKELGLYKIGKTKDMDTRFNSIMKEMSITDLEIIYQIPNCSYLEKDLHKKFSHLNQIVKKKQNHREWFRYDVEIINEFEKLQNG